MLYVVVICVVNIQYVTKVTELCNILYLLYAIWYNLCLKWVNVSIADLVHRLAVADLC